MSSELVTLENAAVPAYITANIEEAKKVSADALANLSAGRPASIRMNGKQFDLVDSSGVATPMKPTEMVPLSDGTLGLSLYLLRCTREMRKAFYIDPYNPDAEAKAPDCFSNDGVTPDPSAISKQSDSCVTCPMNAWGSGQDQQGNATKGKRCSDFKNLAVLLPKYGLHKLKLAPSTLTNFRVYINNLEARGVPYYEVLTYISFDQSQSYPVLKFTFGGYASPPRKEGDTEEAYTQRGKALIEAIKTIAYGSDANDIVTEKMSGTFEQPQIVAPVPKAALPAPAAKPAPEPVKQPQPQDDLGLGEPVKKAPLKVAEPVAPPQAAATAVPTDAELAAELGL